jgi:hypothetical protein
MSVDRLLEIEAEREKTMGDPNFQAWMKELGVSVTYKDPESALRAREVMSGYDFKRMFVKRNFFSIFSISNN